ncbi:hypothetical protein ACJMK2_004501 [Sinanodonta woodiana]|uniref:HEPN domain-containing protein n=1 Tax=Sinanodonta woodiana TaxID=1069815 RepID=A0ABD3Y3D0_SINWO
MADEAPDSDIEEYSSMEQPPLIKQLKTILAEYPDDGQIIKELLQNAEDAGASEVKILFDQRCINTQVDKKSKYRKFFSGPALCFFNDAVFTESDWRGIKMINSSVKENDPLKVGRFGLGFKSIFHITDYPVVLSGDRILFVDPYRSADCVCLTIKLSNLQKWNKLNIEDFLLTLDGTYGVSKEILDVGRYDGTLFWFPFRSAASKLSDTIYNREKVMDLFTSFRAEASSMLIFLTHLMKVSLYERKSDSRTINLQFTLELVNNTDEVRESRKAFVTKIRNLDRYVSENSIDSRYSLSVCTKSFDGDCASDEITTDWMVTNYYKGGEISEELQKLILDDSLGYRPLVGVAALMGKNVGFKGHVFCFLPLPQKTKSVTGLPVHVNGFFALSQNRRHIKWPSAEQDTMHIHGDKSLLWNIKLLTEVLPDAYEILITGMINHAMSRGNSDDLVQCVYASIPSADKVVDEWNPILPSLSGKIMTIPTLMTVNKTGEKSWISCSEAFFATFCKHNNLKQAVKLTVVKVLQMYGKRYVDVPLHVFEFLSEFSDKSTDLNPQSFAALLKEDSIYKSLSREDRFNVLDFLTQDGQYHLLDSLQLLPLQDCTFGTFISKPMGSDRVLLCSKEDMELFPGLEKKFVYTGQEIQWFETHLHVMVKQGLFQIQIMDQGNFRTLLEEMIQGYFGSVQPRIVKPFSILSGSWTQRVWEHIFSHRYIIDHLINMQLIPLLKMGSWSDVQEIEMYQLTDFLIVKHVQDIPSLHDGVYRCLENLSVKVLPSIPLWLQTSQIKQHIHYSTVYEVVELLGRINCCHERQELIDDFNRLCVEEDKKEFASFLAGCTSWKPDSRNLVRCLKIFKNSISHIRNVSVQENATVVTTKKYPVKFHRPFIIGSLEECHLACALGAKELDRNSLTIETLQMMQGENYSFSEKQMFMQYFIQHIGEFEQDENMMNLASTVSFLESNITHAVSRPVDLFDPLDSQLLELFQGENRFPAEKCFQTSVDIVALKKFGLKTYCDVSEIELYETAHVIESWCKSERNWHIVQEKAKCFLKILKDKPALLNNYLHEYTLRSKLMDMRCILQSVTKDPGFPSVLPWFQQQMILSKPSELRLLKFSRLLGSVMPLIDCQNKDIAEAFGWDKKPPQDKVLEQFRCLINVYQSCYKPELLPVIKEIYQELNTYSTHNLLADPNFQTLLQSGCIWRGDGFLSPQEIFLESKRNDLDLTPYLYKLPEEFKWLDSFFLKLGCNKEQNIDVLLKTQVMIKEKYDKGQSSDDDVSRDRSIVISILNSLKLDKSKIQDRLHEILFPIHCDNQSTLVLKPGPECTYCDAQWLREMTEEDQDEENVSYVHEDVSNMTAEELGVKSLTQQLLSDTEELVMEEWGQEEPLTTRLHHLLKEGYQDGLSVPKEIVQNADDAGAKCVYFLYDERENDDAKMNLLDKGMAECQGPAIWAYNDAQFRMKDFNNITRLNAATKKENTETIGKFGLGFCSVYNLTDVPSFISGSNIVIFDPHKSHLGKALPESSSGMKINFGKGKVKNLKMMKRLKNQFKPFQNVFGCNISCDFQGTLFRFPLRTASQAKKSKICDKYYSRKECLELLYMTIMAAGNLLLFTQHIQEIKLFHLPADCVDPKDAKTIYSMSKDHFHKHTKDSDEENILSQVSKLKLASKLSSNPFKRLQKIMISESIELYAGSIIPSLTKEAGMSVNTSWLISWATGTDDTLTETFLDIAGLLPLSAVAVPFEMKDNEFFPVQLKDLPFGFYKNGHLFCFLPLPISCGLPVHINGCFAVTSDRRRLITMTEDDKKVQCNSWNKSLIKDASLNAYIHLLEGIRDNNPPQEYKYYSLWPLEHQNTEIPITKYFIKKLVQLKEKLFQRNAHWQSFEKCVFLDPSLRNNSGIGETAFETLLAFYFQGSSVIMELPDHVMTHLHAYYPNELKNKIVSEEQFFLDVFLPNIEKDFWTQSEIYMEKRNKLVIHALELESEDLKKALSNTRCIPSEPNGSLKLPTELVNPVSHLSDLFSINDEVFPLENEIFQNRKILEILIELGMMDEYLLFNSLKERCESVVETAQTCGYCAIIRCSKILKYLRRDGVKERLRINQEELHAVRNISFLPVRNKPSYWNFTWQGNAEEHTAPMTCEKDHPLKTIRLESAANLFMQCTENLVGCVELVLDEATISEAESTIWSLDIYQILGLKGSKKKDVPVQSVIRQLKTITQEYSNMTMHNLNNCKNVMDEIYSFLDKMCEKSEETRNACFKDFSEEKVILIGHQMLDPSKVAFSLKHDCLPVLFSLQNSGLAKYKHFFKAIGVKEHFVVCDMVKVLGDKREQWGLNPLTVQDIDIVNGLLLALQDSMINEGFKYTDLEEYLQRNIVAPDTDRILRETSKLCLDDSEFETGPDTKNIHGKFSPELALALGVKTKRGMCFDELSFLIPSGQKEKLVTRLRGILSAYPCDDGIMKELLQNADDAQASEIHFIKDYRTHSCEKIFDQRYAPLQGPALCVFNNSAFTKQDIEGIHELGLGNKRDDPLKTGQYGVGFNAVYHLTDVPSFLTKGPGLEHGEILCVFDPTCQYLPKVTEQNPGLQCLVGQIRKNYPDVLTGYLEKDLFKLKYGTMFRFPLRNEESASMSSVSSEKVDKEKVNEILERFSFDCFDALLFVKHVSQITVSNISSGKLQEEYKVESMISDNDKKNREEFFQYVRTMTMRYKEDRAGIVNLPSREVGYTMTVSDSKGRSKSFYIVQRIGFNEGFNAPDTVVHALQENNLGQLPFGGVAVIMPNTETMIGDPTNEHKCTDTNYKMKNVKQDKLEGRAFCFLPLPLGTGLPCHINGHFVLDHEARRSLWKEEKGYRRDWNHMIFGSIISAAFVSALLFVKQYIFDENYKRCSCLIYSLLERFHSYFPLIDKAEEADWKSLAKDMYSLLVKDEIPVFPILRPLPCASQEGIVDKEIQLDWSALQIAEHNFPAYFYDISCPMVNILKQLGMKLVDCPIPIRKSLKASMVKVKKLSPKVVVKFIKSYSSSAKDRCKLKLNLQICNTMLEKVENVGILLQYVQKLKNFKEEVNQLPLLVTSNGILRIFSSQDPIICSKFWNLFPHSPEHFLHCDLIFLCQSEDFKESQVLSELCVQEFEKLLPSTLSPQQFNGRDVVLHNILSTEIPNQNWIIHFWLFIYEASQRSSQYGTMSLSYEVLGNNIEVFKQWSLLPVKQSDKNTLLLVPINKRYTLLDLWSFEWNCDIRKALEALDLPQLCTSIFIDNHLSSLTGMLCSLVASKTKPLEFLNCLYHHKDKIKNTQLTPEQCNSILVFLSQHLKQLLKECSRRLIQDRIKALPLHVTQQGTPTSIDGNENVLVVPMVMPTEGLSAWAHNTGHIFLQQNKDLEELHKLLECTFSSLIDVYSSKILPRLQFLPECHYLQHLWFIKDKLLYKSLNQTTFDKGQQKLISILKSTAFITTNDGKKLASEFYDSQQEVFACMCDEDDFPPSPFGDEQWNEFLKYAGLKTQVTETMLVEFAEKLARAGAHCITENIVNKSQTLVKYLWSTSTLSWETNVIKRLSRVKFIPPHVVSSKLSLLYKQYSESESLICFSGSIAASFESLCWTSMNLLPKWASPESENRDQILQNLGVLVKPPVERVIAHCQNIFNVPTNSFQSKVFKKSQFTRLVGKIYAYLSDHRCEDPRLKEKLRDTPVVFLPENKLLLPARNIVIELKKEEMVEPYLYMVSEHYVRYKDFFIFLGASEKVTLNHYFRVLELVYQKQTDHDKPLLPPEMIIVKKAVENIVKLLMNRSANQTDLNVGTLYLPDRLGRLKDARCLIVADKDLFETRMLSCKLEYFIGFREIHLKVPDPRPVIKALPDSCRPKLLSEVVKERVDMTQMIEVVSDVAENLEHFFHSIEFIQGILRLDAEQIHANIQNSKIMQVEGLRTFLYINEERIESSGLSKLWFVDEKLNENGLNFTLYFQVHENKERNLENNMIVRHNGVIGLIQMCIDNSVQKHTHVLYAIVDCLQYRYHINNILNEFDIDPYDLPQNIPCSIFPCPGTYVPEEFHAFLEQGFSEFEKHEYDSVAYELDDDHNHLDTDASVFIYVRIIKVVESTKPSETGITTRYEIDIGDSERGHIIVYAYNLFKFERKEVPTSQELVSSDSVTPGTLPHDHTCRIIRNILREAWALSREERQRILKRLLLRWHPDKNIGQEDYCKKIFIYIKEVVSKLDDGISLDDENINCTNNAGSSTFTGTEYENLGRRVNRMSAQYSEQYSRHENVYYAAHSREHHTSSHFPIPDIHNARRWIKQAKNDLSSARTFRPLAGDVPAFNWICYMCHQAAEKALKAAIYAKDANRVDQKSHRLASIAGNGELSGDCIQIVRDLELCLNEHTRMRYPDSVSRRQIPADIYTDVHATTALEIAERLILLVDQNYIN